MLSNHLKLWSLCVVFGLLFSAGCGTSGPDKPPRYPALGTITYDGKPLPAGWFVNLVGDKGDVAAANVEEGGKFTVENGLEAGTYKVYVASPTTTMGPTDPMASKAVTPAVDVPLKYREVSKSDLSVEVKPEGDNQLTIAMQKE